MGIGEGASHPMVAHSAGRHEQPGHLSDLERAFDLPVPVSVALEVQQQLSLVGNLLAVARDEILLLATPIGLNQERAIAWGVPQVHDAHNILS